MRRADRLEIDRLNARPRRRYQAPNGWKLPADDGTGSVAIPAKHPGRYWATRQAFPLRDGLRHPIVVHMPGFPFPISHADWLFLGKD
jgi:hypothetical protein